MSTASTKLLEELFADDENTISAKEAQSMGFPFDLSEKPAPRIVVVNRLPTKVELIVSIVNTCLTVIGVASITGMFLVTAYIAFQFSNVYETLSVISSQ